MKPKTMKIIGLCILALGLFVCIGVTIDKNNTYTAYAVDGTAFTEFSHDQHDYSGYIFPAICGVVGLALYLVGYSTSYTQKAIDDEKKEVRKKPSPW
jgi:hypothetical protein